VPASIRSILCTCLPNLTATRKCSPSERKRNDATVAGNKISFLND